MSLKFKKIQCIERAVDILEVIGENKCRTIAEIAKLSSINQATAYNIIKTLELRGFISEANGVYVLGRGFAVLASSVDAGENLPLFTRPILEEINVRTGEAVCVTVLNGLYAEIINPMPGKKQVSVQFLHRSWTYPLNLATGRLLVAMGEISEWPRHIRRHIKGKSRNLAEKKWGEAQWNKQLAKIREDGFVCMKINPPDDEAIGAVAVPLLDSGGELLGAIGSSCPQSRATEAYMEFIKDSITTVIANNPLQED